MGIAEHDEGEMYRVIVLNRNGTEVLVVPDEGRYRLPEVVIPRWQRVAENLTAALKGEWGEEVICLFAPECAATERAANRIHYQVAEHWATIGPPRLPSRWLSLSTLSCDCFSDQFDYSALERSVSLSRAQAVEGSAGPFARLGWFKDLCDWVESVSEPLGLQLNGNLRQLNASPTFSLIRLETNGPALWFKAVGEPNQREFPLTLTLAKLFPEYLLPILADRQDWNGWLTQEVEGTNLGETQESALWEAAASALANLQIQSIRRTDQILAAGAHDLRVASMSQLVRPFMETMASLMSQQPKSPPPILSRAELALLGKQVQDAFAVLEDLNIPDSLGHLDLNPGNIIVAPQRCAFLDWAEAYVGNPFFSLLYLLEQLRWAIGTNSTIEARLIESYCAQWKPIVPSAVIAEVLSLAPLLAVFSYAAGTSVWQDRERLQESATAGYLRSLARRMHREANLLADRRPLCLQ